jgi:hypothetical protein
MDPSAGDDLGDFDDDSTALHDDHDRRGELASTGEDDTELDEASFSNMTLGGNAQERQQQYSDTKIVSEAALSRQWRDAAARTLGRRFCAESVKCSTGCGGGAVVRCNDCRTTGIHYCQSCFDIEHKGRPPHMVDFVDDDGGCVHEG